jgi:hypothetical protein
MNTGFTPGPWRVNDGEGAGNCGPDIFPFLVEAGTPERSTGPVIAEIYGDPAGLPADANARLIAAAPDLYEALAFLVDDEGDPNEVGMHSICVSHQAVLDARAALAKAQSVSRLEKGMGE